MHDAAGVGVEAFQIAPLSFIEQNIESQSGFTRATHASDHVELTAWNVHAQALQVVFFGMNDADMVVHLSPGHCHIGGHPFGHGMHLTHALLIVTQGLTRMRGGVLTQSFGRTLSHQQAATFAAFRAEINQPIAGTNHVQVVLDNDE